MIDQTRGSRSGLDAKLRTSPSRRGRNILEIEKGFYTVYSFGRVVIDDGLSLFPRPGKWSHTSLGKRDA